MLEWLMLHMTSPNYPVFLTNFAAYNWNLMYWSRDKMAAISQTTFANAFLNANVEISIKFSLKFIPKGPINKIPAFWANDGLGLWRIFASPSLNGLIYVCCLVT